MCLVLVVIYKIIPISYIYGCTFNCISYFLYLKKCCVMKVIYFNIVNEEIRPQLQYYT